MGYLALLGTLHDGRTCFSSLFFSLSGVIYPLVIEVQKLFEEDKDLNLVSLVLLAEFLNKPTSLQVERGKRMGKDLFWLDDVVAWKLYLE